MSEHKMFSQIYIASLSAIFLNIQNSIISGEGDIMIVECKFCQRGITLDFGARENIKIKKISIEVTCPHCNKKFDMSIRNPAKGLHDF
jgi:hypothetical protein